MRARIPTQPISAPISPLTLANEGGKIQRLLAPLLELADVSDYLIASSLGKFEAGGEAFRIPRFIFMGPKGGGDNIRVGLFSALRGDEPEGAEALVEFFRALERAPEAAKGFHLYAYPICNPGGFSAGRRNNPGEVDLVSQFWRKSSQPEIYYLEREMGVHGFQGVISLHTAKHSSGFLAVCGSSILEEALVRPAIQATHEFAPDLAPDTGNQNEPVPAGFLTATDELRPVPFEINLGIPARLPGALWKDGTVAALKSVLDSYRSLNGFRQNL